MIFFDVSFEKAIFHHLRKLLDLCEQAQNENDPEEADGEDSSSSSTDDGRSSALSAPSTHSL